MNANKDEAIRAKDIAEDLMKKSDFSGARKVALRAQKLDSNLENISQMIMVCDVHCAATGKLFGNEMDWYGILQVEQNANDITIKKQYRKLALLLHPDKNKLPGAEAAFKLIGESQRILLDRGKRSLHDMKRRSAVSRPVPAPSYRPQHVPTYYTHPSVRNQNIRSNFSGLRPENQGQPQKAQAQSAASGGYPTFWTLCPFCTSQYEYHREHINRSIYCPRCNKQFTAFEGPAQGAPPAKNSGQGTFSFSQQRKVPTQNACNIGQKHPMYYTGKESFPMSGCTAKNTGQATFGFPQHQNAGNVEQKSSTSYYSGKESFPGSGCTGKVGAENVGGKRKRKKIVESSESSDSESSSESVEDIAIDENGDIRAGQDFGPVGGQQPRRSVRSKRQVSYKENLSDDEELVNNNRDRSMENGDAEKGEESDIGKKTHQDDHSKEKLPNGINSEEKMNRKEKDQVRASARKSGDPDVKENSEFHGSTKDSSSGGALEPKIYVCADPDFNDFDKLREYDKFVVGQTWAVYDTADGMPRFYARIKKVFTPGFKLRIAWLEPNPDDEEEKHWCQEELPVSVGKFRLGKPQNIEDHDHLMFSHEIHCEEGSRAGPCRIFPRKGETWALFQNWSINWSSDPDSHREFEYEFVEILSEYGEEAGGISVAYLHKVKGFSSVFCRMVKDGTDTFQIPSHELYRFSHSIPSFKLMGREGKGVPKGSYELDPASLPQKIEEIAVPPDILAEPAESEPTSTAKDCGSTGSNSEGIVIPGPQFHDFDDDKSEEKFQIGQIWSIYCGEEGLPRYYGRIQRIERKPVFKLHISGLEPKALPENVIQWRDDKMPICCGTFSVAKGGYVAHTGVAAFSHEIMSGSLKRTEYTIFPKERDVWAIYKNWSAEIKVSDLEKWEYDVVEVLHERETHFEVLLLELVDGYNSVFKEAARMTIPKAELLRFSHQVPAFRLSEEREGTLRDFLELDPTAMPRNFFSS